MKNLKRKQNPEGRDGGVSSLSSPLSCNLLQIFCFCSNFHDAKKTPPSDRKAKEMFVTQAGVYCNTHIL